MNTPSPTLRPPDSNEPVLGDVLRLAVPATLGMISQWVMSIADVGMVSRLAVGATAERGVQAINTVHLGSIFVLAMVITFAALSVGTQAVAARRWGEGDQMAAARTLSSGVLLALAMSAILFPLYESIASWVVHEFTPAREGVNLDGVTMYLRIRLLMVPAVLVLFVGRGWYNGVGKTAVVMANVLLINVLNVGLNALLIEGRFGFPRLEENGAAFASALAVWIGLVHMALHSFLVPRLRALHLLRGWRLDRVLLGRIVRLSIPSFFHLGAAHGGFLIFHSVIIPRTREGALAVAASGIVWNVAAICFMISLGFGIAAATLLGQGLGSGRIERAVRGVWISCWAGFTITMTLAVVFVVFGRFLAARFTSDPEVIHLAGWLFALVATFQAIDNFGIILSEAFKGAGMTLFVMAVELPVNLILFLGLSWWWGIGLGWGVIGAWAPMILYAFSIAIIMIFAFRAGLWRRGRA